MGRDGVSSLAAREHDGLFRAGALLGFSAGFSPGPLFALVLSQTLLHGIRQGCKVALAPLATDLSPILVATFLLRYLADVKPLLGCIALLGTVCLLRMAYGTFGCEKPTATVETGAPHSLRRAWWSTP